MSASCSGALSEGDSIVEVVDDNVSVAHDLAHGVTVSELESEVVNCTDGVTDPRTSAPQKLN